MNGIKYRSADEMKDSGIEWLGRLVPLDWKVYRAKYIWKKENRPVQPDDMVVTAFRDGQVTLRENRRTEGFTFAIKEIGYQRVLKGDLVISAMDAFAGAMGISESTGKCSPVYSVCSPFKPVEQAYYGYLLKDMAQKNYILSLAKGIRERSTDFRYAEFGDTILTYPTILEQRKIANFLDIKTAQFDSIIAKKEQLIVKLEEAKKSLISEVVTGKVKIVDGQLVPRQPEEMKDSGVEWLGMIPKEWSTTRIKYVSIINPAKSEIKRSNLACSFLPMNKIRTGFIETDEIKPINEVYDGYSYVRENDIVVAKVTPCFENMNTVIARGLENGIGFGTTEINVIRATKVSTQFLYYNVLESNFIKYGTYHMYGVAGLKRVPTEYFEKYVIALPQRSEEREIVEYLNRIICEIDSISLETTNQISLLKSAKQSLISESVTGKIDLRDWEIIEQGGAS